MSDVEHTNGYGTGIFHRESSLAKVLVERGLVHWWPTNGWFTSKRWVCGLCRAYGSFELVPDLVPAFPGLVDYVQRHPEAQAAVETACMLAGPVDLYGNAARLVLCQFLPRELAPIGVAPGVWCRAAAIEWLAQQEAAAQDQNKEG